jgi:RNA polymerase sigma factor (sigma-70 family)
MGIMTRDTGMVEQPAARGIDRVRRAVVLRESAALSDGELLEAFVACGDATFFEALVRRHGPMVLGVCRRILGNVHDADDAFQAAFLVLLRRAKSIVPRESVGNWLYGVAVRTALEARKRSARLKAREKPLDDRPLAAPNPEPEGWQELRPHLDFELKRLPDKYRTAVVLCHLEGRTRKEAARQLGLAEGTLSGRLTTARRLLAKRLSRRGVAMTSALLAGVLSRSSVSAQVAPVLVASVTELANAPAAECVAALADGVTHSILRLRLLKLAAISLMAGSTLGAAGWFAIRAPRGEPPAAKMELKRAAAQDGDLLQGTWVVASVEIDGQRMPAGGQQLTFRGDRVVYRTDTKGGDEATFRLNPAATPKEIDIDFAGGTQPGIYEIDGNRLKWCWSKGRVRPTSFDTGAPGSDILTFLYVFEKRP